MRREIVVEVRYIVEANTEAGLDWVEDKARREAGYDCIGGHVDYGCYSYKRIEKEDLS